MPRDLEIVCNCVIDFTALINLDDDDNDIDNNKINSKSNNKNIKTTNPANLGKQTEVPGNQDMIFRFKLVVPPGVL